MEDQEQVRELAVEVLNQAGYSVQSASDGASALLLLEKRKSPVDLLVTDVVMPQMSGPELAEQVCGRVPAARVLYISGYTTESPVPDYLSEPFTPAELLDKVRKTLDEG